MRLSKEAVREVITALGMIASMLYVGWEIRQNTAVSRVEAYHAIMADRAELIESFRSDPGFFQRWILIQDGALPEAFSREDQLRNYFDATRNLRGWEGLFLAVHEGVLPPDALDILGAGGALETPHFRATWPDIRTGLQADFATYLEKRFGLATQ